MQVLAVIADTAITRRILDHLNLDSAEPPITARAQGPPDLYQPGPDYDVADPIYTDWRSPASAGQGRVCPICIFLD